jgi:hypothetical protein
MIALTGAHIILATFSGVSDLARAAPDRMVGRCIKPRLAGWQLAHRPPGLMRRPSLERV